MTGVNAAPCADLPVNANSPSLVETISPGRNVGSRLTSNEVSAVAGAIGNQLLAVQEGGFERAVTLAVLGDGGADFAADENLGFAVRANRPAGFRRSAIDDLLHRKMLAVAQANAERHGMTGAAAAVVQAFLP